MRSTYDSSFPGHGTRGRMVREGGGWEAVNMFKRFAFASDTSTLNGGVD